jgi:hypothetical protein
MGMQGATSKQIIVIEPETRGAPVAITTDHPPIEVVSGTKMTGHSITGPRRKQRLIAQLQPLNISLKVKETKL